MIRTYSLKADGDRQLSKNFKVREFACSDGSDVILIDDQLVILLQAIRDKFARPVHIGSGYRTLAYNNQIGGAKNSRHIYGKAADIDVGSNPVTDALLVAMTAQALGVPQIGCYMYADGQSWVHIGSAAGNLWRQAAPGQLVVIPTFLPLLRQAPDKNDFVERLQQILAAGSFYTGGIDGVYGQKTLRAVRAFQKAERITIDGIVGPVTWRHILL